MSVEESLEALRALGAEISFESRDVGTLKTTRMVLKADGCGRQSFYFPVDEKVDWEVELAQAVRTFRLTGDPEHKATIRRIFRGILGEDGMKELGLDDSE